MPTKKAACAYFESHKSFAAWDREILHHYIEGAIVSSDEASTGGLAYHPLVEATVFGNAALDLSESELASPRCPVLFQYGA